MSERPPEDEPILETARENPDAVDLDKILPLLDADLGQARNEALNVLFELAEDDPDRVVEHVDLVVERLDDEFVLAASTAAQVLASVGQEQPEEVLPAMPELVDMLDQLPPLVSYRAAGALIPLLSHDPDAFVPYADDLVDVLVDPPDPGIPTEEELQEMSPEEREEMKERLSSREKQARQDIARSYGVQEFAANAVVEVAEREPQLVADRAGELPPAFAEDPPIVQTATLDAVASVAEHDPDAVDPIVDDLIALSQRTTVNSVRAHAIQALGYAGATEAIEPLREIAASDDPQLKDDVRELATDTADFLEENA